MKLKAKMLWALFLAAVVNLVNTAAVYMFGFFSDWPRMKDFMYYLLTTLFIWIWFAVLVLIQEQINKQSRANGQAEKP